MATKSSKGPRRHIVKVQALTPRFTFTGPPQVARYPKQWQRYKMILVSPRNEPKIMGINRKFN